MSCILYYISVYGWIENGLYIGHGNNRHSDEIIVNNRKLLKLSSNNIWLYTHTHTHIYLPIYNIYYQLQSI